MEKIYRNKKYISCLKDVCLHCATILWHSSFKLLFFFFFCDGVTKDYKCMSH